MLWWPSTRLTSAPRPAFPAKLRAVLFKQWMVVISGSFPKDLRRMLRGHLLASNVLVALLVHWPPSEGAANCGTLRNESRGLSASFATLMSSKIQGVRLKAWKELAFELSEPFCGFWFCTQDIPLFYLLFPQCPTRVRKHNGDQTTCFCSRVRQGNILWRSDRQ